jgi:hypothetical protein
MEQITCPKCKSSAIPVGMAPDKTLGLFWICTRCDHRWHYWTTDDAQYWKAQRFITNKHYPLYHVESEL